MCKRLFLIAILFLSFSFSFSQTNLDLSKKISISANNKSLEEVLTEIEDKEGIHFSLSNEKVNTSEKISLNVKNKSLQYVLEEICRQLNLEYAVVEKQVILKPQKTNEPNSTSEEVIKASKKFTISGYVTDQSTNEILIGTTVYIEELKTATATNSYGFYSITLNEGQYTLEANFIGYEKRNIPVFLTEDQRTNITLSPMIMQLKSVEVLYDEKLAKIQSSQMSEANIKQQDIKSLAVFLGEADVIKSLQTIPGIKSHGDGSAYFHVRGGEKDQNMILLDEAPIYNPSHLFGFFTSFSNDAIKDIEIYKADIPVSKESGLSSLIDIKTKDGNMNHFALNGGIGPIASKLSVEGPLKKEKSSYFISTRRSNLEWLLLQNRSIYDLYFYDVSTKFNFKFNDRSRLFLTLYTGKDYFGTVNTDLGKIGISWGNNAATLRFNHLFSERVFSNTTIYASKYYYNFFLGKGNYWNETISNLSVKSDYSYYLSPKNTLKFGLHVKGHYFNPGNLYLNSETEPLVDIPQIPKGHARLTALYVSNEQKLGSKISARYGVRLSWWQNIGATTLYLFDENYNVSDTLEIAPRKTYNVYFNPEPRISLSYSLDSSSAVKASYQRTAQYLQFLSNSNTPFTSLDVWVPSSPTIKPQTADQWALGYYKNFRKKSIDFSVEAYYKQMYNQIEYEDHANLLLNPLLEGELRSGDASSYGLEFLLSKSHGRCNGSIAYTLSKTIKQAEDINNGNAYSPYYDRPHDVCISLNYATKKRWSFSANFYYYTGSPITTPTSFYYYQGTQVPIYAQKNNERLPDYHRLDVAATVRLNKNPDKNYKHSLGFAIYNVYNHKNPFTTTFYKTETEDGNFVVAMNTLNESNVVATQMSLLGIVPSIHYNFSWK